MSEVILHLTMGFYFFLRENLPAISSDVGTWGPGLGAFVLGLAVSHRFFRGWAVRGNRQWGLGTTVCLWLILPVLFVISFIVPGVALQLELLGDAPWFERHPL